MEKATATNSDSVFSKLFNKDQPKQLAPFSSSLPSPFSSSSSISSASQGNGASDRAASTTSPSIQPSSPPTPTTSLPSRTTTPYVDVLGMAHAAHKMRKVRETATKERDKIASKQREEQQLINFVNKILAGYNNYIHPIIKGIDQFLQNFITQNCTTTGTLKILLPIWNVFRAGIIFVLKGILQIYTSITKKPTDVSQIALDNILLEKQAKDFAEFLIKNNGLKYTIMANMLGLIINLYFQRSFILMTILSSFCGLAAAGVENSIKQIS